VACVDDETFGFVAGLLYCMNSGGHRPLHRTVIALGAEHVDDLLRGIVTEQLSPVTFVIGNPMTLHKIDKIARRVARQGRADEVRIAAQEVFGSDAAIGEIAPAATGNADFFGQFRRMIDQQHTAATLAGGCCAHHAGGTGTDYNKVETLVGHNDA